MKLTINNMKHVDFTAKLRQLVSKTKDLEKKLEEAEKAYSTMQRSNAANVRWKDYYKSRLDDTEATFNTYIDDERLLVKYLEDKVKNSTPNKAVEESIAYTIQYQISKHAHYIALIGTLAIMSIALNIYLV